MTMHRIKHHLAGFIAVGAVALFLSGCGGSGDDGAADDLASHENTVEVQAYYAVKPEFFSFKTLA